MNLKPEKIELIKSFLHTEKESLIEKIKANFKSEVAEFDAISLAQEEELEHCMKRY